jgi:hypothetical protein
MKLTIYPQRKFIEVLKLNRISDHIVQGSHKKFGKISPTFFPEIPQNFAFQELKV